ncbi:MAG: OmpA family protein [Flavobacteriales bacterium]|nr:OmpA family protein [Flavobacteriales bacterium]
MRKLVLFLPCLFLLGFGQITFAADDFKKLFHEAQGLMFNENYEFALPVLLKLDSMQPNNANIQFQIGMCYFHSPLESEKSIPYIETAVKSASMEYQEGDEKETGAPLWAHYLLGEAYNKNYNFDKAEVTFEQYKALLIDVDSSIIEDVDHQIKIAKNGKTLIASPVNMIITNLGDKINSSYADYKPVLTADESELIFTSRREGSTGDAVNLEGKYFEDIYISDFIDGEWAAPKNIGAAINTDDHEATVGLSADGQKLFIYKFLEGSGDIYVSDLEGSEWASPKKMGSDVNLKSWESHASMSADSRFLYFTSDREGGYGGTDIWYCQLLPDGNWGLALNMGPQVNSIYDEDGGYLHPDGDNFFFSSKGHSTMGGYDIMFVHKNIDGSWGESHNLGYPVNTTGDDVFYIPTTDGTGAYYSSFRKEGYGEQDIYKLDFPDVEEKSLTIYKGVISTRNGEPPSDVVISVVDVITGEVIGRYTANSKTGEYLIVLQPGKDYDITYEGPGCYFYSDHVEVREDSQYHIIERAVALDPLEVGTVLELQNLFYEFDKAALTGQSTTELDKLFDLLVKCPLLKIEIDGHTDSKGSAEYNIQLSQKRAQSVVDYLVERGIPEDRLKAKGYGEEKPIASDQNPDGTFNEDVMQLNRRTEMKVLAVD